MEQDTPTHVCVPCPSCRGFSSAQDLWGLCGQTCPAASGSQSVSHRVVCLELQQHECDECDDHSYNCAIDLIFPARTSEFAFQLMQPIFFVCLFFGSSCRSGRSDTCFTLLCKYLVLHDFIDTLDLMESGSSGPGRATAWFMDVACRAIACKPSCTGVVCGFFCCFVPCPRRLEKKRRTWKKAEEKVSWCRKRGRRN